jgi:hypothetical protein
MITEDMILALIFLVSVTVFQLWGHKERPAMGIVQLIAFVIMLPGTIWAMVAFPPEAWFIPLLFVLVNGVVFARDMK